jgi:hypothetical protein
MKVSLYREIKKEGSLIKETFSFSPKNHFLNDDSRSIRDFLILLCSYFSISSEYKLLEKEILDWNVISKYAFEEGKRIPLRGFSFVFDYIPSTGKRKCSKCIYSRKHGRIQYCSGRMKIIESDFWNDCLYWKEDSFIKANIDVNTWET